MASCLRPLGPALESSDLGTWRLPPPPPQICTRDGAPDQRRRQPGITVKGGRGPGGALGQAVCAVWGGGGSGGAQTCRASPPPEERAHEGPLDCGPDGSGAWATDPSAGVNTPGHRHPHPLWHGWGEASTRHTALDGRTRTPSDTRTHGPGGGGGGPPNPLGRGGGGVQNGTHGLCSCAAKRWQAPPAAQGGRGSEGRPCCHSPAQSSPQGLGHPPPLPQACMALPHTHTHGGSVGVGPQMQKRSEANAALRSARTSAERQPKREDCKRSQANHRRWAINRRR